MKLVCRISRGWWRAVVFILWIVALTSLLVNQSYTIFLRPEFGILLGLSVLTLCGFLLSNVSIVKKDSVDPSQIIRGCILILPLAYVLNADERGLDAAVFQNRSPRPPSVEMNIPFAVSRNLVESAAELSRPSPTALNAMSKEALLSPRSATMEEVSMLDIYTDPQKYRGKRISVIGMLTRNEKVQKDFGEKTLVVFRFTITCCAADAIPLALVILDSNKPALSDNTWIEVSGIFDLVKQKQYAIPVLHQTTLKTTTAPKIPYVF